MSLKVLIRVDASPKIGAGHVVRCAALAEYIRVKGGEVLFVCHSSNLFFVQQFIPDFSILALSSEIGSYEEIQELSSKLTTYYRFFLIDHYSIGEEYEQKVRSFADFTLVFDDYPHRNHFCDILVDQTLERQAKEYQSLVNKNCQLLLSSTYAVVSQKFFDHQARSLDYRRKKNYQIEHVLVSVGATDPQNYTLTVLQGLSKIAFQGTVSVLLADFAPHIDTLKKYDSSLNVQFLLSPNNIAEHLAQADLVVGAAGSSTWERSCLAVPTITLLVAENQKGIVDGLFSRDIHDIIDCIESFDVTCFLRMFNKYISSAEYTQSVSRKFYGICDGLGGHRVYSQMIQLEVS